MILRATLFIHCFVKELVVPQIFFTFGKICYNVFGLILKLCIFYYRRANEKSLLIRPSGRLY